MMALAKHVRPASAPSNVGQSLGALAVVFCHIWGLFFLEVGKSNGHRATASMPRLFRRLLEGLGPANQPSNTTVSTRTQLMTSLSDAAWPDCLWSLALLSLVTDYRIEHLSSEACEHKLRASPCTPPRFCLLSGESI